MSPNPNFDFEKSLIPSSCRFLMGLDEVGRGPWAGPVTVGAIILDLETFDPQVFINLKVRDSKALSASQRQSTLKQFNKLGLIYKTFSLSSETIDEEGIGNCINKLFKTALEFFGHQFDYYLIDGNINVNKVFTPSLSKRGMGEISADSSCFSVAAASIVAKVTRDLEMDEFDKIYPQYDFCHNKGYGTAKHQSALQTHGPCKIHRYSYRPIAQMIK